MKTFQLTAERQGKRVGQLHTRAGSVATPFFMPVGTRGTVKLIAPDEISALGFNVILANTYHLELKPGAETVQRLGGLHSFMNWSGPILTDSGGFQVFSLSRNRRITDEGVTFNDPATGDQLHLTPELSMQIQFALGADIIMAFDDVTGLGPAERTRTREAMQRTHRWLERSVAEHKRLSKNMNRPPLLFGIAQGGLSEELRAESVKFVQSQPVAGIAIGGLSVGESRSEMHTMLDYLTPLLDPERVHYLMGVGHPLDLRHGLQRGMDMFDCVLPTRNGRHGQVWVAGDKNLNLRSAAMTHDSSVLEPGCDCPTCSAGYSRAWLRHLFNVGELLPGRLGAIHNLAYLQRVIAEEVAGVQ